MKVFAENRKARTSYEFLEFFEAGIVLTGAETKSIRNGGISIIDAFASLEDEEVLIREMNIEPYKYAELIDYDPKTPRKLLLHKKEIIKLKNVVAQKGLTIVPLKAYFKRGIAKIEFATARGKKMYQKKESLKIKDLDREAKREMRER